MAGRKGAIHRPDRIASKILTEAQFAKGIKLHKNQLDTLDAMAAGIFKPRNAIAILGAIRAKLEWGYAKPKQETELSGTVSITVVSPIPSRQSRSIPAAIVEMPDELEACAVPETVETTAIVDPMLLPSLREAYRLGPPEPQLTAEERREAARDAWLADNAARRTTVTP